MSAPWYEENSISINYVQNDMKSTFFIHHTRPTFMKLVELVKIIDKHIEKEYKKYKKYNGVGFGRVSYLGYVKSIRNNLVLDIKKEMDKKKRKLALELLRNNTIILHWMCDVLYRPPGITGKKTGLRYNNVENSFEDHVKTSCEN